MRTKKIYIIVVFRSMLFISIGGVSIHGNGQSLVPNGSFEEYIECPDSWNQIDRATGWSRFRRTPDYFNACDQGIASVPLNFAGNKYAATGQAYACILAWEDGGVPNHREHFGAQLNTPLIPDVPVFLSFKVTMATGGLQDDCRYSVDGVGIRFTMEPYPPNIDFPLPNYTALHLASAPLDTAWFFVSGVYVPDSAYPYIVIGGFFDDVLVNPIEFNPAGNIDRAIAFIDDVCVSYEPDDCGISMDVQSSLPQRLQCFPNPFTRDLNIHIGQPPSTGMDLWIHDLAGRVVWQGALEPGQRSLTIDGSHLREGAYLLAGRSAAEVFPSTVIIRLSP